MNREATAYHEAGHVVVALLEGLEIEYATIKASGHRAGHVKLRGKTRRTTASRLKLEGLIIVALAGDIAQRRFAPRSSRSWQTTGDRRDAVDMALSICGSGESATAYLAWLTIVTRDLVHGRWDCVERVAEALMQSVNLSGDELWELVAGRLPADAA